MQTCTAQPCVAGLTWRLQLHILPAHQAGVNVFGFPPVPGAGGHTTPGYCPFWFACMTLAPFLFMLIACEPSYSVSAAPG